MTEFTSVSPAEFDLPTNLVARLLSPALVVDLGRVRRNLGTMLGHLDGEAARWRPHIKTAKIPEVFAEYAHAGLRHFKCATVREARELLAVLGQSGVEAPDLLVAYPLLGPALEQLGRLAASHPGARVSVLCEVPGAVAEVPAQLDIYVDVNPGMHRTGIPAAELQSVLAVARAAGSRFGGVHYYDGHLHGSDADQRRRSAFACYDAAVTLVAALEGAGVAVPELITSGTPTFREALAYAPFRELGGTVHRISPGTVVYHDQRCEQEDPHTGLVPAAVVLTRVVSHPGPGRATCDAGSKSLAAEAGDPCAIVLGHPGWVTETPSEEHLPLRITDGPPPERGAVLLLVPRHVCPTVNLAETAVLLEPGRAPRAVAVAARAHDLGLLPGD